MSYENILSHFDNGITTITINRPSKLNALNRSTIKELHEAFKKAEEERDTKVIIVTGSGEKAFVAGADISEFADYSVSQGEQLAAHGQALLFDFVAHLYTPVIAAINGFALGGGLELAMAVPHAGNPSQGFKRKALGRESLSVRARPGCCYHRVDATNTNGNSATGAPGHCCRNPDCLRSFADDRRWGLHHRARCQCRAGLCDDYLQPDPGGRLGEGMEVRGFKHLCRVYAIAPGRARGTA